LHTFTVSTRQERRSPAGAGGLASPGQPGAGAALGFGFSHGAPRAEIGLVYPWQGKEEGILIAALARKGREQQPCSAWASKKPPC